MSASRQRCSPQPALVVPPVPVGGVAAASPDLPSSFVVSAPAEILISLVGHLPSQLGKPPLRSSWKVAGTCFPVSLQSFRSSVRPQRLLGMLRFAAVGQLARAVPPVAGVPLLTPAVSLLDVDNQVLRVSYIRGRKRDGRCGGCMRSYTRSLTSLDEHLC